MTEDLAWEHARSSTRRYELLPRGDQWVLCQVRPWRELFTYADAYEALIDYLCLEHEPETPSTTADRNTGPDSASTR